jgi:superfamily II DNA helicase RecQ
MARRRMINGKTMSEQRRRIEHARLQRLDCAETTEFHRQLLLCHFVKDTDRCGACDVCDPNLGEIVPVTGRVRTLTPTPRAVDPELLAALKWLRLDFARARRAPADVVFHDATLAAINAAGPRAPNVLRALPGVGAKKLADFGSAVLNVSRVAP